MKPVYIILICILSHPLTSIAQMSVEGRTLRDEYGLKGSVKSVTEAHWNAVGLFLGRQNIVFSRTGKVIEETSYFGEGDDDIESLRLCNFTTDGTMSGLYCYRRDGEKYAVLKQFTHWIALYDPKGHIIRKQVLEFQPKTDKYGSTIWRRTAEEVFHKQQSTATSPNIEKQNLDTIYTFDKKTGRIATKHWQIHELDFQGEGSATYIYSSTGDTLDIIYNDPSGRMPASVHYDYTYVSKLEKERMHNSENRAEQKGKAVSPILEKRKREAEKRNKKKGAPADTMRLDVKTVTTRYDSNAAATLHTPITIVRTERYDDSSKLVSRNITETSCGGKKETREWRWARKELTPGGNGRRNGQDQANQSITVYQLTDAETTRWIGTEMTYQVKDHFSYDRNGDPVSRTRSGKTLAKPATWRFAYRDYDEMKNWTRRTYSGPADEEKTSTISPNGNIIEKISYSGEAEETDTRIIKYY